MFVMVRWQGRTFGIPLAQIQATEADEATHEAIEDWRYWVERGYEF